MAFFSGKSHKQALHPVLTGLSVRALNALYSAGKTAQILAGNMLTETQTGENRIILILEGSGCWSPVVSEPAQTPPPGIKTTRHEHDSKEISGFSSQPETADLVAPEVLTSQELQRMQRQQISVRALTTIRFLSLETQTIATLDPEIQAHLYRNLHNLSATLNGQMQHQLAAQAQKQNRYFTKLGCFLHSNRLQYSNSTAIKALIQKVPNLPPYASKLTTMLINDQVSARQVAAVAKLDPSLTASVLKTVNSAYYGLTHKVLDFHHAFVLLGFNQIYQIVINKGIQSTMPGTPAFQHLQFHSVMISVLSNEISITVRQGNPPLLSTLGLLHDIGKSVILLMKRQQPKHAFLINLLDPDVVGFLLLKEWKIPNEICGCLEYLSLSELVPPDQIPAEHRTNLTILNLAHQCSDYLLATSGTVPVENFSREQFSILNSRSVSVADFVQNKLIPSITSRGSKLPKLVQNLLDKKLKAADLDNSCAARKRAGA